MKMQPVHRFGTVYIRDLTARFIYCAGRSVWHEFTPQTDFLPSVYAYNAVHGD